MGMPIIPRIARGRLYFQTADVFFPTFAQPATAVSPAESHRLHIAEPIDRLIAQLAAALADIRRASAALEQSRSAARREAQQSAQVRQLCRQGGVA